MRVRRAYTGDIDETKEVISDVSKPYRIYGMIVALLVFFIPGISVIPYWIIHPDFIPAVQFSHTVFYASLFFAALLLSILIPIQLRVLISIRKPRPFLKKLSVMIFAPVFCMALGEMFFEGPVAYTLHLLSNPHTSIRNEKVLYTERGFRYCKNRAVLTGGFLGFQRELCGLSSAAVAALKNGGGIRLYGNESRFGFQAERYSYSTIKH